MILDCPTTAALLRCSKEHLQRLARKGEIPAAKVGKDWVFVEEDVVAWVRMKYPVKIETSPAKRGRPRRTWS